MKITPKRLVNMSSALLQGFAANIAYFLSGLFPRDREIWLFGAWEGLRYSDNARYLFEHVLNNQKKPRQVYWLTRSQTVYNQLKNKGYPVILSPSWKAWWYN